MKKLVSSLCISNIKNTETNISNILVIVGNFNIGDSS